MREPADLAATSGDLSNPSHESLAASDDPSTTPGCRPSATRARSSAQPTGSASDTVARQSADTTQIPHLLALADLLLWIAQFLAPPRRGRHVVAAPRSTETDLQELLRHAGLAAEGWTAPLLSHMEGLLGSSELELEKARLFDADVLCPADECSYVRRDKGVILADIVGFQRAFGFQLSEEASERADHISAELELAALLLVMWVRAKDEEAAGITREAWVKFASDHLGEWLPDFTVRLARTTQARELVELARLLECVWMTTILSMGMDAEIFLRAGDQPHATPPPSATGSNDLDLDTPYECGMIPDPVP